MSRRLFLDEQGTFVIRDYNRSYPFSNFLPAVAGTWGIPLWAFYVNRGQALISFGVCDKDHAIAEFYPADRAYRLAPSVGFRTFIKINRARCYEPFSPSSLNSSAQTMYIRSHDMRIEEVNRRAGLRCSVTYFTLPQEPYPALIRKMVIENITSSKFHLGILDGLPRLIPFNLRDLLLKHLSRTMEAWMRAEVKQHMAIFHLLVDPQDVAQTKFVDGAHFCHAFSGDTDVTPARYIVDPVALFGTDTSFGAPASGRGTSFTFPAAQICCGRTPCAFSMRECTVRGGQQKTLYSMWGSVFDRRELERVRKADAAFIDRKEDENEALINEIKQSAFCASGRPHLDHYIQSTYLDNILRGGYPFSRARNKVYYIFGRKHGDLERDYNKFKILPSFFSEGEANYRDVNQNRRMDLFFNPFIEKSTLVYFLNLIKMDGYNPLSVCGDKLYFNDRRAAARFLTCFGIRKDVSLMELLCSGFYLGELFSYLKEKGVSVRRRNAFSEAILENTRREPQADFGEGYWIDHWHYNLDLIESYLYFFPDKLKELFLETDFMFWDDEYRIKRRSGRYVLKGEKVRQHLGVEEVKEKKAVIASRRRYAYFLREDFGKGETCKTNLAVKMLSIVLNKAATLDPHGLGVEMEADKPGWCDSLNGLPALFGSSYCETLEVKRASRMLLDALNELTEATTLHLPIELYEFFHGMLALLDAYFSHDTKTRDYLWWNTANHLKESFRETVFMGIDGSRKTVPCAKIKKFLFLLIKRIDSNASKALAKKSGVPSAYFYYEVKKYNVTDENGIEPVSFKRHTVPLFLESAMHAMRTQNPLPLVKKVKKSSLFDKKLKMYRLNESLENEPLEIGRIRVFPPGWLENESVWLHMEYKFLLELLKNGLYDEFYRNFYNCAVCFFEPERYSRSILENSSFVVSSVHPDRSLWGKGFVARLTGATVELLHIWILMCLGRAPFFTDADGALCMRFAPLLKGELFTRRKTVFCFRGTQTVVPENTVCFSLFSSILVVYHNPSRKDTFSEKPSKIVITQGKKQHQFNAAVITSPFSHAIRQRQVDRIDVYLR